MTRKPAKYAIIALTTIICVLVYISAEARTLSTATGFRTSDKDNSSRIVIDFTHKPDYQISARKNPDRIVIDIKNAIWENTHNTKNKSLHLKGIRYNKLSNNKLQLVLDLKAPLIIKKHFILPPKNNLHRLVIDIATKDTPAKATPSVLSNKQEIVIPIPKLKELKKIIIAIDAGHGGHDPGTTGYHGTKEKNITMAYAFAIKEELENLGSYDVVLTRKDDSYINLKKRVEISRNAKANMFLSIHADSHNNRQMSGLSIYTLSEKASDKEAEALAQKENNAGILNDVDVHGDTQDITALLIDLVQRETKNLSAEFAENIIKEIHTETEVVHHNPHRFAGFKVLTGPDIPSALLELGYLSNKKEERMLLSQTHKKKLAQAIVRAIDKHFRKYPVD